MAKKKELTEEQRLQIEKLYKKGVKEGKIKGKKGSKGWFSTFKKYLGEVGDFITKDLFGFTGKKNSKEEKGIIDSVIDYVVGTSPSEKKVDLLPKDAQKARKKFLARAEEKLLGAEPFAEQQQKLIEKQTEKALGGFESPYEKRFGKALSKAEEQAAKGVSVPYESETKRALDKLEKSAEETPLPGQATLNDLINRAAQGVASPSEMAQLQQQLVRQQAQRADTGQIPYQDVYQRALQTAERRVNEPQQLPYESELGRLLSKGFERLDQPLPQGKGFDAEAALAKQKFTEETLPALFSKFTPGGGLRSSTFQHAFAKANADLAAQLEAQKREADLAERRQRYQEEQQRANELRELANITQQGQKIGIEQQRSAQDVLRDLLGGAATGGKLGLEQRAQGTQELGQATTQSREAEQQRLTQLGQAIESATKGTDLEARLRGMSHEQLGRLMSGLVQSGRVNLGAKELEGNQLFNLLKAGLEGYGLDIRGSDLENTATTNLLNQLQGQQTFQANKYGQFANLGFQMPYQTQQVPGQIGAFPAAQQAFNQFAIPLAGKALGAAFGLPGL